MKPHALSSFLSILLTCLALSSAVQAVNPPPDGGYPNFTTAEGQKALFSLTAGAANTAVGWYSLFGGTTASFNTGVGTGTLLSNNGDSNTAVGAAALLLNTTGSENTAVGTAALVNNNADANSALARLRSMQIPVASATRPSVRVHSRITPLATSTQRLVMLLWGATRMAR